MPLTVDVEFDPETAARPPAEIEINFAAVIREEWQAPPFVFGYGIIPAATRIRNRLGITSAPDKFPVGDPDDVEIEVVERIAKVPFGLPGFVVRPVPRRGNRIIRILEPPDRVYPFMRVNLRRLRRGRDLHTVPFAMPSRCVGDGGSRQASCRFLFNPIRPGDRARAIQSERAAAKEQKARSSHFRKPLVKPALSHIRTGGFDCEFAS